MKIDGWKDCLYHKTPTEENCKQCDFYEPEHTEKYQTSETEWEEETINAECMAWVI